MSIYKQYFGDAGPEQSLVLFFKFLFLTMELVGLWSVVVTIRHFYVILTCFVLTFKSVKHMLKLLISCGY